MKVAFITLGCKLNYAETSTYERGFVAAGFEVVPWRKKADVYLINTCSVTETANSKSRNEIRKVHRINPDAAIVVVGCYAALRPEEIAAIDGVVRVFGNAEKHLVVPETIKFVLESASAEDVEPLLSSLAPPTEEKPASEDIPPNQGLEGGFSRRAEGGSDATDRRHPEDSKNPKGDRPLEGGRGVKIALASEAGLGSENSIFGAYSSGERTRSFLKVQDGCDNFCRYCTVPYARGRSRNLPICECVKMAQEIAARGVKEVVLTGVNTGDFGRSTGESFLDLLKALNEVEGIERYRISSIEPNLLSKEIIDWIASGTKFQPHFHIPLQVGTDELLKAMGRKYTTAEFADKIAYIRSVMEAPGKPKVFFGIDVMVGLPGETPELFEQSYNFLERLKPAFIHVFPYSKRPGTPAASMPGQVSAEEKKRRVAKLEELCAKLNAKFIASNKGISEKVLWESKEKNGNMSGYTGNYIKLSRKYDPSLSGQITQEVI